MVPLHLLLQPDECSIPPPKHGTQPCVEDPGVHRLTRLVEAIPLNPVLPRLPGPARKRPPPASRSCRAWIGSGPQPGPGTFSPSMRSPTPFDRADSH
jgi:hypothetical protein